VAEGGSPSNEDWFARANAVIPGGVDSPVRSFASVGGAPFTVVRGEGAFVFDADGMRYLDLVQSYGAVLLGHAHPVVTAAVTEQAALGWPRTSARGCPAASGSAWCRRAPRRP
jgi:glutamate-1-semialdehyde 2,1-aminomutase